MAIRSEIVLVLTSAAALICACGGSGAMPAQPNQQYLPGQPGQPGAAGPSAAAIDSRIAALSYDTSQLLDVQSIASGQSARTQIGAAAQQDTADGSDIIVCTQTRHSLQQNFDEVAVLRPTTGIVWPGALVKVNAALRAGTPEPITLPRAPITLRLDLPGIGEHGTLVVAKPSSSSVQAAVDGALAWWNDNAYREGYKNPASSSYLTSSAFASEQLALDLGLNVSWASVDVGTQFSYTSSATKSAAMMVYKQGFYTVTFDTPSSPSAVFTPAVDTEAHFDAQLTPESPPGYVQSVTYGRIILFRMETTDAVKSADMKAALEFSAGTVPVEASLESKYKSILAKSTITAITIGGNAEAASQVVAAKNAGDLLPIITGKNAVYSKENPGVPIAYTVRFLKDNAIAKMGYTTDYTANECQRSSPAWITVRNSGGLYTARAFVKYVDHATGEAVQLDASNITIGTQHDFLVPAGAANVECWAEEMWGFGWTRVFLQDWGAMSGDARFCLHGTTLSPGWDRCE